MTGENVGRWRRALRKLDKWVREPVVRPGSGRHAPRMFKPWPALALVTAAGIVGGWVIFASLARLAGSKVSYWWPKTGSIAESQLFDIVRSAATVAALVGGLYAILYAYRKQRVEEAAGRRADAEGLSRRYQDAAEQLGHDNAAVRLAGVYAMGRLADEWPEERQTCVDVLCAYLRMLPTTDQREVEVRSSIMALIAERVDARALLNWSDLDFDFRGALLEDIRFERAVFRGRLTFRRASFTGDCYFGSPTFGKGANFWFARVAPRGLDDSSTLMLSDIHGTGPLGFRGFTVEEEAQLSISFREARWLGSLAMNQSKIFGSMNLTLRPQMGPTFVSFLGVSISDAASVTVEHRSDPHLVDGIDPAVEASSKRSMDDYEKIKFRKYELSRAQSLNALEPLSEA